VNPDYRNIQPRIYADAGSQKDLDFKNALVNDPRHSEEE